jgi:hypothetical protein
MAWHVRYRHDPAHRWLRTLIGELAQQLSDKPPLPRPETA